jgi:hypothetical protein
MVALAFRSILTARMKFRQAGMEDYANMVTGFAIAFGGYMLSAVFVHAAYPRYFYLLLGIAYALPVIFENAHLPVEYGQTEAGVLPAYDLT